MMAGRFLLDTNHASPLVTLDHPLRARVVRQMINGDQFFITSAMMSELLRGLHTLPRARRNLENWLAIESSLNFIPIGRADIHAAMELHKLLRDEGKQLSDVDAQLAALALRNGFVLLTTDKDFGWVRGLTTETWIEYNQHAAP